MPFDVEANVYLASVAVAPEPADSGAVLTVEPGHGADLPPCPFTGVVSTAGTAARLEESEIVRVTAVTGDVLTLERAAGFRRAIVVGDRITASIVEEPA